MKVRKVGGIGRVTEKILNAFEIRTVEELYDKRLWFNSYLTDKPRLIFCCSGQLGGPILIPIAKTTKRSHRWDKKASARNGHSVRGEHGVK